jgi:putative endonuclease
MSPGRDVGRKGERRAARLLRRRGYKILALNYRCRHGEIDIVAYDGGEIVFVEVKTRLTDEKGTALEAVTPQKQRKLARVAEQFLAERGLEDHPCRFDVVAVAGADDPGAEDELVRGAFVIEA